MTTTHHNILPHHYNHHPLLRRKEKVVFIVGATGCGKSKLSNDLATRVVPHSAEIINSDKMKVYNGLDITTNKISVSDRRSVPHHLLGDVDPFHGEFTPAEFRISPWRYPPWRGGGERRGTGEWNEVGRVVDEDAVREINQNTCRLTKREMGKIRLRRAGGTNKAWTRNSLQEILTSSDFDGSVYPIEVQPVF